MAAVRSLSTPTLVCVLGLDFGYNERHLALRADMHETVVPES